MIIVFRYGHRVERDKRITTHCGLIAHAFNADQFILNGDKDTKLLQSLQKTINNWGTNFHIDYEPDFLKYLKLKKNEGFSIIHLTMYGESFKNNIDNYRKNKNTIIIIGSQKVPKEVYHLADYNVSIGNLPHSEAAALAVFLYELFNHKVKTVSAAKKKIIPSSRGKIIKS